MYTIIKVIYAPNDELIKYLTLLTNQEPWFLGELQLVIRKFLIRILGHVYRKNGK